MTGSFWTLTKRMFLFIAVNILIVITVGLGIQVLFHYLGIQITEFNFYLVFYSIIGMGGAFVSLWLSKWQAVRLMGVQIISPQESNPAKRELVHTVHHLARKAGLPKEPEVGIYNSPEVNAFATGPSKKKSLVAVSSGLLQQMNDEETHGVLAHEVSHIANGDMVTMTLVQGVVNVMVHLIAHLMASMVSSAISRDRRNFFLELMIRYVFITILYIPGSMLVCAFSRWREYRADHGGAKLAGRQKMILALERLKNIAEAAAAHPAPSMPAHNSRQHAEYNYLKINNQSQTSMMTRLFSTHPPITQRIKRLQRRVV